MGILIAMGLFTDIGIVAGIDESNECYGFVRERPVTESYDPGDFTRRFERGASLIKQAFVDAEWWKLPSWLLNPFCSFVLFLGASAASSRKSVITISLFCVGLPFTLLLLLAWPFPSPVCEDVSCVGCFIVYGLQIITIPIGCYYMVRGLYVGAQGAVSRLRLNR